MPQPNKIHTFRVSGSCVFPTDMLRLDACWPTSREGVEEMLVSLSGVVPNKRRVVTLNSNKRPDTGRWASFGWDVVEGD